MKFDILTLFPEMFEAIKTSIIGKAEERNLIDINITNIRDFSEDKHKKVDDTPYGGGAGMVIKPDVVYSAYKSIATKNARVIYMSPQGKTLNQSKVEELSKQEHLIILCGHYEGLDQRVLDTIVDEEKPPIPLVISHSFLNALSNFSSSFSNFFICSSEYFTLYPLSIFSFLLFLYHYFL